MFLEACFNHSIHGGDGGDGGGSLYDDTSCLAAWSRVPSAGVSVSGPMFLLGVSVKWGLYQGDPPPIWWRAGGTHPTGMLSCYISNLKVHSHRTKTNVKADIFFDLFFAVGYEQQTGFSKNPSWSAVAFAQYEWASRRVLWFIRFTVEGWTRNWVIFWSSSLKRLAQIL